MEQRKLIKLGNSSFAIALPKNWVDKSGLKKGENVFLEENGKGEIMISSLFSKKDNLQEMFISLDGKEEDEIARDMISAYVSGNSQITFSGEKSNIKIAKEKAKNFLNLELVEEKENKIVLKDLLDIQGVNIENFIRRMDNNIKEMFSLVLEIINKEKKAALGLKELEEIDKDITKFYFLIWRFMNLGINNPTLQSSLKIDPKKFVNLFWTAYNLEQIGDELKRIARKLEKVDGDASEIKEIISVVRDSHNKSMKSFFEMNKNLSKEVILKKKEIIKMCEKLSEIEGCEGISEKLNQISAAIHSNSKMAFYSL